MEGWRGALALGIVFALGLVVVSARPTPPEPSAAVESVRRSTTPTVPTTPTSGTRSTTTTTLPRQVELERMIGDLYWAWFDGVHRNDMAAIETVAGTEAVIEWAVGAFDSVEFTAVPTRDQISVEVHDVLLDRPDCLVVSVDVDYRSFLGGDVHSTVDVYFPVDDGWGFARKYVYERELWQVDCDHLARRSP